MIDCHTDLSHYEFVVSEIDTSKLSRRERQIIDILYRLGEASAKQVMEEMDDAPSYSAVRALLTTLLNKQKVTHKKQGKQYIYKPAQEQKIARKSAVKNLLSTFFDGKADQLVAMLLDPKDQQLTEEEIEKIRKSLDES
ncbi:BlaI/MecI/CopY family transcriptional regulator [Persicirhabdus sediminis]|uniref:BlaI/MecI/CopY family transcriptional regulator n=1 Tax=Persicirhabdus sediminis TaxID=454144 RepID=UPI001F309536|nr:BlaI/MecI/CopY family transcriptional regulator [Persicirhabdus sediminis]